MAPFLDDLGAFIVTNSVYPINRAGKFELHYELSCEVTKADEVVVYSSSQIMAKKIVAWSRAASKKKRPNVSVRCLHVELNRAA